MNCKICNDDVIATIYNGHCSEMCEMQGKINDLETKLEDANKEIKHWESIAHINGSELETVHQQREQIKNKLKSFDKILNELYKTLIQGDGPTSWQIISLWKKEQKDDLAN